MRRLATLAVVVVSALVGPTVASGQNYSFGDWARDHGYSPGDAMPGHTWAANSSPAIDNLDGIGEFDWTTTEQLFLHDNRISSIEAGAFSGLTNLMVLLLERNQLSSIESGTFNRLTNLEWLWDTIRP